MHRRWHESSRTSFNPTPPDHAGGQGPREPSDLLRDAEAAADRGQLEAALQLYRFAIAGTSGEQAARARLDLAAVHQELEQPAEAETALRWALTALVAPGERARALNQLGVLRRLAGAHDEAGGLHQQARIAGASAGDLLQQAVAIGNLAELARLGGDMRGAAALRQQSAELEETEGLLSKAARSWAQERSHHRSAGNLRCAANAAARARLKDSGVV